MKIKSMMNNKKKIQEEWRFTSEITTKLISKLQKKKPKKQSIVQWEGLWKSMKIKSEVRWNSWTWNAICWVGVRQRVKTIGRSPGNWKLFCIWTNIKTCNSKEKVKTIWKFWKIRKFLQQQLASKTTNLPRIQWLFQCFLEAKVPTQSA